MKEQHRDVLKLKGKPITGIKLELTKEMREKLKNLEKSEVFQSMLIASGIRTIKKGSEK